MARFKNAPVAKGATVLLVDDDATFRKIVNTQLSARGQRVCEAGNGHEALQSVKALEPDVIVLDLGLPDFDGIEVTQRLREVVQTPIIILSVRASASDKIAALNAGADDYLTKPCRPRDLTERIHMALLRAYILESGVFDDGDLMVDLNHRTVRVRNNQVHLTATEYDLLKELILNAGRLLTQDRLAHDVWNDKSEATVQLLRTTMSTLRQKLESSSGRSRRIIMEPGVGYRLRAEL